MKARLLANRGQQKEAKELLLQIRAEYDFELSEQAKLEECLWYVTKSNPDFLNAKKLLQELCKQLPSAENKRRLLHLQESLNDTY